MRLFRQSTDPVHEPVPDAPAPLAETARTLESVSRDIAALVPALRRLAEAEELRDLALAHSSEVTSGAVRSIIAARRLRDQYFWPAMNETAWALLLELFADRLEGERRDPAALAAATDVPLASVLHWLDWLAGRTLITRHPQGENEATTVVGLTESAADEMRAYLTAALRLSPWVQ